MCSRILATRELSEKHAGENIRNAVDEILMEFNALRPGNVYITDNASNMKAAMQGRSWLGCAGHNLNLVLAHGLKPSGTTEPRPRVVTEIENQNDEDGGELLQDESISGVSQLIALSKSMVAHVKRSRIQAKLPTTLKQSVSTRWNSVLTMLKSIVSNMDELKKLADEHADRMLQRSLLDINTELLRQTVGVLEQFDAATRTLSTDLRPSLHLIYPTKVQLKKHLLPKDGDGPVIINLKQQLSCKLDSHFPIKPLHLAATILDPRLKNGILSAQEKADAVQMLRNMMSEVEVISDSAPSEIQPELSNPPKKRKVNMLT